MARNYRSWTLVVGAVFALVAHSAAAQGVSRIAARDTLTVTVFGVEDLSGTVPGAADGTVTYPHLGALRVAGLETAQVAETLSAKLKDAGLLLNPQVTVELIQTPNKKVIVTGAVRSPGQVPFAGDLTLFEALALAGAATAEAGDLILVVRANAGGAGSTPAEGTMIEVSRSELESGRMERNVSLQDGDQVVVPRAQQVFISGQVRSPGAYNVPSGSTVMQAIILAGGLTERGTYRGVKILRDGKEVKNVKNETPVRPGDTIVVRASAF
jgi:polysaccharide export outer membrane protein